MKTWSLKQRMMTSSIIVLALAFSAIYLIAISAYITANKMRLQEVLASQIYSLMAQVDDSEGSLFLPETLRNERLNNLNSGLAAFVLDASGHLVWRSRSSDIFESVPVLNRDYSVNKMLNAPLDGRNLWWVGESVTWEFDNGRSERFYFLVGEKETMLNVSVREFRNTMLFWLLMSGFVFLIVLVVTLNKSLKPLELARKQIESVRMGQQNAVEGDFPKELLPLTSSINQLLESELRQKTRYRDTLGNLAHSLKTPLAIIRSELEKSQQTANGVTLGLIKEQINRINEIVKYQLNRTVITSSHVTQRRTEVADYAAKIVDALNKVYHDKQLQIELDASVDSIFPGEPGDFMELLGNLADNACKWAKSRVSIHISMHREWLRIEVSDDGPGIEEDSREKILRRGRRLDQQTEGQGLGLSIVSDIVASYAAQIEIDSSQWGGARFLVALPTERT